MIATIKEVIDYMQCPMSYKYRYIDGIDPSTVKTGQLQAYGNINVMSQEEIFDQEIHKLGYHVFNYIQDGKYPSEYLLRQKWSSLWCKHKSKEDVMFDDSPTTKSGTNRRLEKLGVHVIQNLHQTFKDHPGIPILVGQKTTIKIGSHQISVTIDLVRERTMNNKRVIEIVDFKTWPETKRKSMQHIPHRVQIDNDLEMTAVSLAFEQLTGINEEQIMYYDMVNNHEHVTKRSEKDRQSLLYILDALEQGIKKEIYYPVFNQQCNRCSYQRKCIERSWSREAHNDA